MRLLAKRHQYWPLEFLVDVRPIYQPGRNDTRLWWEFLDVPLIKNPTLKATDAFVSAGFSANSVDYNTW